MAASDIEAIEEVEVSDEIRVMCLLGGEVLRLPRSWLAPRLHSLATTYPELNETRDEYQLLVYAPDFMRLAVAAQPVVEEELTFVNTAVLITEYRRQHRFMCRSSARLEAALEQVQRDVLAEGRNQKWGRFVWPAYETINAIFQPWSEALRRDLVARTQLLREAAGDIEARAIIERTHQLVDTALTPFFRR